MRYRHYLLDAAGCICAAAYFSTSDYTEARAVAASLAETGSDVWSEYDLWQGTRHLSWAPERVCKDVVDLRFDLQRRVVELEEVLNEGFAIFQKAAKLRETHAKLRGSSPKPPLPDVGN